MTYYTQRRAEEAHAFQPVQWFCNLEDTISSTVYFSRGGAYENKQFPPLGARRVENAFMGGGVYKNVAVHGYAEFIWVWNNSGSALAQGTLVARRANQSVSNITSGDTYYAYKASTFTADKEIGGIMIVADDAGGAGAAPEGEIATIYDNDTGYIYFQPDLTTALAANDDLTIIYPYHAAAASTGAEPSTLLGIVVAPDGIADGYMGWVCCRADAVKAKVAAAGTAITVGKGLIAANGGLLTNGSTSPLNLIVAYALNGLASDTVSRYIMVQLNLNRAFAAAASAP